MTAARKEEELDLDPVLSVRLIREHVKITDVRQVSDEQLILYRKASVEACEKEIGIKLKKWFMYEQSVDLEQSLRNGRRRKRVRLDYPVVDNFVHFVGGGAGSSSVIKVREYATDVVIPIHAQAVDLTSCCSPCGGGLSMHPMLAYNTGFRCVEDIPSSIIVGCLKYIAWSVMNPGDELKMIKDGTTKEIKGLTGTNDAVWASGAGEEWRRFKNRR